jgi:hypothetical protein
LHAERPRLFSICFGVWLLECIVIFLQGLDAYVGPLRQKRMQYMKYGFNFCILVLFPRFFQSGFDILLQKRDYLTTSRGVALRLFLDEHTVSLLGYHRFLQKLHEDDKYTSI